MPAKKSNPVLQLIARMVDDERLRRLSDAELLGRFLEQQDEPAFNGLVRRHGPMVLDVCRSVLRNAADAEDAFQATFMVLASKGNSVRKAGSVGSWLHGVAYRTACNARRRTAARRRREVHVAMPEATEPDDLTWREVRAIVHEELSGLGENYRAPLVLCYLEGKTHAEAATHLGLPVGTLKGRLERGRALLRSRLVRRGLGLTAGIVVATWPAPTASASVPKILSVYTVKAAGAFAADRAATVLRPELVALTQEVLKAMLYTKLKSVALVVLVTGILGGGAGLATFATPAGPPRESQSAQQPVVPDGGAKPPSQPKPAAAGVASARTRKPRLVDPGANVEALAWSPDGKLIANKVMVLSPSPDGRLVSNGRALQLRDAETGAVRRTLDEADIRDVRFSPDGKSVAGSLGGVVKLWDPATGKEQRTFQGVTIDGAALTNIAFSRDGRLLAAAGKAFPATPGESDGVVILWETGSGKLLWQVRAHRTIYWDRGVTFSPDGKLLATGAGRTIKLWDTATGKCKHTLRGHGYEVEGHEGEGRGGVWSLAFSPDGKLLASGGLDGTVRLWDPESGKFKQFLTGGYILDNPVIVAFAPDGKRLAVGGTALASETYARGDIRLFDARTGKFERAFTDLLRYEVCALAFSPDGETLAVSTYYKQLLLLPLQK